RHTRFSRDWSSDVCSSDLIARALLREKVYCVLDRADAGTRQRMRLGQPNFFLTFDRLGIDPFTQRFPVTLLLEGTVRGTGGIRIVSGDCATSVPGLYVAGDAATRERSEEHTSELQS